MATAVFQLCWHIEYSTFTASSSRLWNSSTGFLSATLALFVVMLPKAQLTSHSRMSGCRWVTTPLWLSRLLKLCLFSSSVYSCHLFFFLKLLNLFIFSWRIIALQYCVGFCQTSTWFSHRFTYVPFLLKLPPQPTHLGCFNALVWSHIANSHWLSVLHMVMYMLYVSMLLPPSIPPSLSPPPPVSMSLFSMSVSPLLPFR